MSEILSLKEYQELAKRTYPNLGNYERNKLHMRLGVITEFGEVLDMIKKHIAYNKALDLVNIQEEISDICWYLVNDLSIDKQDVKSIRASVNKQYTDIESFAESMEILLKSYLTDGNSQALIHDLCIESQLLGLDFYKGLKNNIDKLRVRFPEKFDTDKALNRDLVSERLQLEK